jgi:putative FmdB family regulatory protein
MPTYEYKCTACDFRFEAFQSITEDPVKRCPACGEDKVERLISAGGGLLFKGSGFYITDHRSDSYKREAKKDMDRSKPKTDKKSKIKAAKPSGVGKS